MTSRTCSSSGVFLEGGVEHVELVVARRGSVPLVAGAWGTLRVPWNAPEGVWKGSI